MIDDCRILAVEHLRVADAGRFAALLPELAAIQASMRRGRDG